MEDCAGIYGLEWVHKGETLSFCSNAPLVHDELLTLISELRKEQAEMKEMLSSLNRLEHKLMIDQILESYTQSAAELDPEWPKEANTMQDVMKRRELREKYGE